MDRRAMECGGARRDVAVRARFWFSKAAERYKRILIEWNGPENPSSVGLKAFLEHGLELKLIADPDPDRAVLYSVAR